MADIVAEIRQRVLKRLGDGGIRAISRRFRIMDDNHSLTLSESELQSGLADCGLTLSNIESRKLVKELDTGGDGMVSMAEFMKVLRGPMPKCRKAIVDKAYKAMDKNGDGQVTIDDIRLSYDASRNPEVLGGKKTEDEVLLSFLATFENESAPDGIITKSEFEDYYHGVSNNFDDDHQFVILVTKAWRLDQPTKYRPSDLKNLAKEGFQSSAYRCVTGATQALPKDDEAKPHDTLRFATMISNDINPFPMPKAGVAPKGALGSYDVTTTGTMNHKTRCFRGGNEVAGDTKVFDGEKSRVGLVPNGLHDARGFIICESTTGSTMGKGTFDEEAMNTFTAGKEKERAHEAKRKALASAPFATAEPNGYHKSSAEHAPMLRAARATEPALTIHSANKVKAMTSGSSIGTGSRFNGGSTNAYNGGKLNEDTEAELMAKFNATKQTSMPRGYKAPSANMWETTQKTHFAQYDCKAAEEMNGRFATKPVSHKSEEMTEEGEMFVAGVDQRFEHRNDGEYGTEKYDKLKNRFDECEVDHKHDVKGTFGLKNGSRQIGKNAHHPRDIKTTGGYNQSGVVSNHFQSSNAEQAGFLKTRQEKGY